MRRGALAAVVALAALAAAMVGAGYVVELVGPPTGPAAGATPIRPVPIGTPTATSSRTPTSQATPTRLTTSVAGGGILRQLARVRVVPARPAVPGYARARFGQRWADIDRNGCDTRNDTLRRQLVDVELKPGTRGCVVTAGRFVDPYTGRPIEFRRGSGGNAAQIHVDHVVALAMAWDLGAARWPAQRRLRFANDPRNLLVVDGPANMSKGDDGPAGWLPVSRPAACAHVARYLAVAIAYVLPITAADAESIRTLASSCDRAGLTRAIDAPLPRFRGESR